MGLFKKKKKFPTKIFVIGSLLGLFVLGAFFYLIKINLFSVKQVRKQENFSQERYLSNDPFITKVMTLKDTLKKPIINEFDPSRGDKGAKINIVYFTDFECGYCYQQEKEIRKIMEEFKGDVFLIRKDYPKTDMDSFSWKASIAGRCALEQGSFWKFHDALYEEISTDGKVNINKVESKEYLEPDFFISLASDLGMRKNLFKNCLSDKEVEGLIQDNIIEAEALGIKGIPFIYINGKEIMGEVNYEDLEKIITKELEAED